MDNQGLDLELLDDLWKKLDDVYKKLIDMDELFDKLSSTKLKFAFAGDIKKMTESLYKLDLALGLINGHRAAQGLRGILEVIEIVNKIEVSRRKLNVLNDLAETLVNFRSALGGGSFRSTIVNVIAVQAIFKPLLNIFKSIIEIGSGLTIGKLEKINDLLNTFVHTVDSLAAITIALSTVPWGKANSAYKEAIVTIIQLVELLKSIIEISAISSVGKLEQTGVLLEGMVDFLRDIGKLVEESATGSNLKSAPKLFRTFTIVTKLMIPLVDSMIRVINSLSGFSPAALSHVGTIIVGFGTFYRAIGKMLEESSKIVGNIGILRSAVVVNTVILPLIRPIQKIVGLLQRLDQRELSSVARIFDGIGKMYVAILEMVKIFNQSDNNIIKAIFLALRTWISLNPFINVIIKVINAAKDVDAKQLTAIGVLFRGVGQAMIGFSELLKSVGKEGFFKSALNAMTLNLIILPPFFAIVRKVVKATSGLSKGQLEGIGSIMSGMGAVLRPLAQFSRDVRRVEGLTDLVKTFFSVRIIFGAFGKLITQVVKSSKEIKGGKSLDGYGALLESLAKILKEFGILAQSDALDKNSIKAFQNFFEVIPHVLNKIDFDEKSAKGLEGFIEIITRLIDGAVISQEQVAGIKGIGDALINLSKANFKNIGDTDKVVLLFEGLARSLKGLDISKLADLSVIARNIKQLTKLTDSLGDTRDKDTKSIKENSESRTDSVVIMAETRRKLRSLAETFIKIAGVAKTAYSALSPTNQLKAGVRILGEMGNAVREVGEQLRDAGEELKDFGIELVENLGIGKIFESQGFKDAVSFDKIGTSLKIFGGLTDEARKSAEDFAFEIGRQYPLSANDALNATLDLIKAGQDLASVEFILPAAADLAALSDDGNLENITNTLIAAEGIFKRFDDDTEGTFGNISRVSDLIAAAADVSTASVESLGEGLKNAGPAADAFGLSLEETSAILAIFNDAGIASAQGGTALRSLLNALDRPQTATALRNLGISLFDQGGSRRPINEIINDIGSSLEDLPDARRTQVLQGLADTFGRQGLNILLGQGEDAIANVVSAMNDVAPASDRARDSLDNLAGDMVQLEGSTQTLIVAALQPLLEDFFRPLVQVARFVVDGLLALDRQVLRFVATAVVLTSTILTLIGGAIAFLGVLLQVGGALITVAGFALNFVNVIVALIGGTTAIVAGFLAISSVLLVVVPVIAAITLAFISLVEIFRNDFGGAKTELDKLFSGFTHYASVVVRFATAFAGLFEIFAFGASLSGGERGNVLVEIGTGIARFINLLTGSLDQFEGVAGNFRRFAELFEGIRRVFDLRSILEENRADFEIADFIGDTGATDALEEERRVIEREVRGIVSSLALGSDSIRNVLMDFGDGDITSGLDNLINSFIDLGATFDNEVTGVIGGFFTNLNSGVDFGQAFDGLLTNLDRGLGVFARDSISLFARIFGLEGDLVDNAINAAGNGFSELGDFVLDTVVNTIRNAVINNRDTLKGIFVSLFKFFFSPLKAVKFFANLFGIKPLQQFISGFESILTGLVGGLFDTFVNVLEGQSIGDALLSAFGEGAEPTVRLITELSTAISAAFTIIGNVFNAFTQDLIGEDFSIGALFNSIVTSLADSVQQLNDFVLVPLSQGNILGAIGSIFDVLKGIFLNFFTTIGNVVSSIDLSGTFVNVGTAILDAVMSGIALAFIGVTALTGIDFSVLSALLNTDLSDVLSSLTSIFAGDEDRVSIFENIVTIVNSLSDAFSNLFTTFSESENVDADSLTTIQEFLGYLAGLALDTILLPLTALDTLLTSLATLDGEELLTVGTSLATIFGAMALVANAAAISGAITSLSLLLAGVTAGTVGLLPLLATGLTSISTAFTAFAGSALGVVAGIAAIFLILNAVIKNVDEFKQVFDALASGDFGDAFIQAIDALVSFLASIAFTLFDLLGFGDLIGTTEDEFMGMIRGVGTLLLDVFRLGFLWLSDSLSIFLQGLGPNFLASLVQGLAGLRFAGQQIVPQEAIDNMVDGLQTGFARAQDVIQAEGGLDLEAFFASGANEGNLQLLARHNANLFKDGINQALADSENPLEALFEDTTIQRAIATGIDAGVGDQIIADLVGQFGSDQISTLLTTTIVPQLDTEGFGDFTGLLGNLTNQGVFSTEEAIELLTDIALTTDDEQVRIQAEELVAEMREEIEAQALADGEVPVDTEIDLDISNSEEATQDAQDQIEEIIEDAASGDGVPVEASGEANFTITNGEVIRDDVKKQLSSFLGDDIGSGEDTETEDTELGSGINLGFTEASTPEEVAAYATEVTNLQSQVALLATELASLPETGAPGILAMDSLLITITSIGMKTASFTISLLKLVGVLTLFGSTAFASFSRALSGANIFFGYANNQIATLANGLVQARVAIDQLGMSLGKAAAVARELEAAIVGANSAGTSGGGDDDSSGGGSSSNSGNTGGDAIGGNVPSHTKREVVERGDSEAFMDGDRMYLLTGSKAGKIEPLSNVMPNLSLAGRQRANAGSAPLSGAGGVVNNASSVIIEQGDIIIQVAGTDATAASIANSVSNAVSSANDESASTVNEELRTNFR